jgi:hypothetical protein
VSAELCSNSSLTDAHGPGTIALKAVRHEARMARTANESDDAAEVRTPTTSSTVREQMPATIGAPLDLRRLSFEGPATGDAATDARPTLGAGALLAGTPPCAPDSEARRGASDSGAARPMQRGALRWTALLVRLHVSASCNGRADCCVAGASRSGTPTSNTYQVLRGHAST